MGRVVWRRRSRATRSGFKFNRSHRPQTRNRNRNDHITRRGHCRRSIHCKTGILTVSISFLAPRSRGLSRSLSGLLLADRVSTTSPVNTSRCRCSLDDSSRPSQRASVHLAFHFRPNRTFRFRAHTHSPKRQTWCECSCPCSRMNGVWPYQVCNRGSNQDACRTTQDIAGEFDARRQTQTNLLT